MFRLFRLAVSRPLLVLAVLCLPLAAHAADDALAQRLISLRAEVEALNHELETLREEQRTGLQGLAAQRAELKARVQRQQLARHEARRKLDEAETRARAAGADADALRPLLARTLDALAARIRSGLPFRVDERLAEIDDFRTRIDNGSVSPARAVNRLWALFEDEFRLTRDNSLQSQTVTLGDEHVLAEVAKLGTMLLYFRTQDGRIGQAVQVGDDWRFVVFDDRAAVASANDLFEALHKQIHQGYFELPLAAIAGGAR